MKKKTPAANSQKTTSNTNKKQRWVIKAGSQMVCSGGPLLLRSWAQQISLLSKKHNVEIIWVTSGAISTAKDKMSTPASQKVSIHEKQAFSAIGQPIVMELYNIALQAEGLRGAQILLTYDDLLNKKRKGNFKNTMETLLSWKIVPVLNENDAVATEEIKFGDNDSLSAKVAIHMKADKLIILTDVDGFYDSNPTDNPQAQLISEITSFSKKILNTQGLKAGGLRGTGGMYSKLIAAQLAHKSKIDTHLVKGDRNNILIDIMNEKKVGTHVKSKKS